MKSDRSGQHVPASWISKKWLQVSSNVVVKMKKRVVMTVMETTMAASTAVTRAITPTAVATNPTTAMTNATPDAGADGQQNMTKINDSAGGEDDGSTKTGAETNTNCLKEMINSKLIMLIHFH